MDAVEFDRIVDRLPDWERMPSPKSVYDRMVIEGVEALWLLWEVERREFRQRYEARMRRIEFMERTMLTIVACFTAGLLLLGVVESCSRKPDAAKFLEVSP